MFARALALACLLLAGCVTVQEEQVKDWPTLAVHRHVVAPGDIYPICGRDLDFFQRYVLLALPLACSAIDFENRACHVFITETTAASTLAHELAHCRGWDHGGLFQRHFDYYKATGHNPPVGWKG